MPIQVKGCVTGNADAVESLNHMRLMHVLQAQNNKRLLQDIENGQIRRCYRGEEQLTTLLISVLKGQIEFDSSLATALADLTSHNSAVDAHKALMHNS